MPEFCTGSYSPLLSVESSVSFSNVFEGVLDAVQRSLKVTRELLFPRHVLHIGRPARSES